MVILSNGKRYHESGKSSSYQNALDEANSNIEDAQSYAWSSYDEMGDALDNLTTVNP